MDRHRQVNRIRGQHRRFAPILLLLILALASGTLYAAPIRTAPFSTAGRPVEAASLHAQPSSFITWPAHKWPTKKTSEPNQTTAPTEVEGDLAGSFSRTTADGDAALKASADYFSDRALFEEAFAYLREIAFSAEYNDDGYNVLKRWEQPIRLNLVGDYDDNDSAILKRLIGWLGKIEGMPAIILTDVETNHAFHFVPLDELNSLISDFPEGNWGIAWVYWTDFVIGEGLSAIAADVMTREEKNHIIQEEFVQSLGLLNDAYTYPDSLFQQEWTTSQHPSAIDFALIQMLYSPAVSAGMDPDQAYAALVAYYFPDSP